MPEDFNLSGPYEIFSSLIGFPNLLYKKEKYPPLLWISSIKDKYSNDTGYHIEPYGYNLTFNKRPFNESCRILVAFNIYNGLS